MADKDRFFRGVLVATIATIAGGIVLSYWHPEYLGIAFHATRSWLSSNTNISRGGLLVLLLVLAIAAWMVAMQRVALAAARTKSAPPSVSTPTTAAIPDDFELSPLGGMALATLINRIDTRTDLTQLYEILRASYPMQLYEKAHIAREMEAAERANIVSIDRLGRTSQYYHVTALGRDWVLDQIERSQRVGPDTLESYWSRVRGLAQRFAERERFLDKCDGARVRWRGTVGDVEAGPDETVRLSLLGESGRQTMATAIFTTALRQGVLGLHSGDRVVVTGHIARATTDAVEVAANGYDLERS